MMKVDIKDVLLLSITCDKNIVSGRQYYVHSYFIEVLNVTESDLVSRQHKVSQKVNYGQVRMCCI